MVPPPPTITAIDDCDQAPVVTFEQTSTQGSSGCLKYNYIITRTWTVTDENLNTTTHTQLITVSDNNSPILTGVPSNATTSCGSIPAPPAVTAWDNCSGTLTVSYLQIPADPST